MDSTNKTDNLNLSQFVASDKPNWLTAYNNDMEKIDAAVSAAKARADTATKLAAARSIRTNLASTAAASFDGSADVTPGVTGVLPVSNGGTGNTYGRAQQLYTDAATRLWRMYPNSTRLQITTDIDGNTRVFQYWGLDGNDVPESRISCTFLPYYDNDVSLGSSSRRWKNIYAYNGAIQTSDRTQKQDIGAVPDDAVIALVEGLGACSYKMINGTSGRTHYGFIAQDLEDLMARIGLDSLDFAGFIKSPRTEAVVVSNADGEAVTEEKTVEGAYAYGLRYEEFIPVLWRYAQLQKERMERMEAQNEQILAALAAAGIEVAGNAGDA